MKAWVSVPNYIQGRLKKWSSYFNCLAFPIEKFSYNSNYTHFLDGFEHKTKNFKNHPTFTWCIPQFTQKNTIQKLKEFQLENHQKSIQTADYQIRGSLQFLTDVRKRKSADQTHWSVQMWVQLHHFTSDVLPIFQRPKDNGN